MKAFVLLPLTVLMLSCSNVSKCKLADSIKPFPRCHSNPPEHEWTSFDGLKLPYVEALPKSGKPKAVVILFPGTDGTTADYVSVTNTLKQHGYAVYGSENRSFAYGPKTNRANPPDWRPWIKDMQGFMQFVKAKQPGLKVFWHGHSFGGVEVLEAAAEFTGADAPNGIIVHSPGYALLIEKKEFWRGIGYRSIAWLRVPHLRMMDTKNMPMTDSPEWDCRWKHSEDRVREGIKVKFFIEAAHMGLRARRSSTHLPMPVLAMWGGQDRMTLGGKVALHDEYDHYMRHELAGGRATHVYRENGQHLLTEGSTRKDVLAEIVSWLDKQ